MLIYLADLVHNYKSGSHNVPLNVALLAGYARKLFGAQLEIRIFKYPDLLLDAIDQKPPDILGLSNYCWNYRLNAFVGGYAKQAKPDLPVVMGGPNIRIDEAGIQQFLGENQYVDSYCMFQGEQPFAKIVGGLLGMPPAERTAANLRSLELDSVFSLHQGRLRGQLKLDDTKDLDFIPSPYLEGFLDAFLDQKLMPLFETNRGCPYSCSYCCWGVAAQKKLKFFSLERVQAEMEYVADRGIFAPSWKLADANFGVVDRDVEIARFLRRLYEDKKPFDRLVLYWDKSAKDRMIDIAEALRGLGKAYVALQTLDPQVAELINRKNISLDRLSAISKELSKRSGRFHTDILLGLPGETMRSHLDSLNHAVALGFDSIGGGEVRLIMGADLERDESRQKFDLRTKYRLSEDSFGVYRGRFIYEMEESPRSTKWISEEELIRLRVVRAFFYFSFTVGEFLPLLKYVASRGVPIMDLFAKLLEYKDRSPLVSELVAWVKEKAENEWLDSPAAAAERFADPGRREDFLRQPVVNLNFDTYSRLMLSLDTYRQFLDLLVDVCLESCPDCDPQTTRELATICLERNYFLQSRQGRLDTLVPLRISGSTAKVLKELALLAVAGRDAGQAQELKLWIDQDVAGLIQGCAVSLEGASVARVSALAHMMSFHMRFAE